MSKNMNRMTRQGVRNLDPIKRIPRKVVELPPIQCVSNCAKRKLDPDNREEVCEECGRGRSIDWSGGQ